MEVEKERLLFFTNYYYPDPASLAQLCKDLCEGLSAEYDVTVICSVPCYNGAVEPKYLTQAYYWEEYGPVHVVRVRVPRFDKRRVASRIKNILAYFFRAIFATSKVSRADVIVAESQPPVLGGLLGVAGKGIQALRGKKSRLIYVVQDFNPEQVVAAGLRINKLFYYAALSLDKFNCGMAEKVIVVGRDMLSGMAKRYTKRDGTISRRLPRTVCINNCMDSSTVYPLSKDHPEVRAFRKAHGLDGKFVIMYSGNIGLFYDLPELFQVIERFKDREDIAFPFVGEGALKARLMEYAKTHGMKNVMFLPYQDREVLAYSLNSADVHWIVNAEGVKGVSCPSKLYGILAVGKPALAVLEPGTEARTIIEYTRCGLAVSPKDYDGVAELIEQYAGRTSQEELQRMGGRGYAYFKAKLTKEMSIDKYLHELRTC